MELSNGRMHHLLRVNGASRKTGQHGGKFEMSADFISSYLLKSLFILFEPHFQIGKKQNGRNIIHPVELL